ncbi:MAG: hypothetical protein O8C63_12085 [Candidatus Methanoperedens sp.]|nr:hypothetical protein [Candidatus Methanoperedens sp.]
MNAKTIVAIAAILVVLAAGYAVARPESSFWNGMMGYGTNYISGMMGSGNSAGYCGAAYDDFNGVNATQ